MAGVKRQLITLCTFFGTKRWRVLVSQIKFYAAILTTGKNPHKSVTSVQHCRLYSPPTQTPKINNYKNIERGKHEGVCALIRVGKVWPIWCGKIKATTLTKGLALISFTLDTMNHLHVLPVSYGTTAFTPDTFDSRGKLATSRDRVNLGANTKSGNK